MLLNGLAFHSKMINGSTGVPIHIIYRTKDGNEKKWSNWATQAPSCEGAGCEDNACQVAQVAKDFDNIIIGTKVSKRKIKNKKGVID